MLEVHRRNKAVKVQTHVKIGFYKPLILPVLLYSFWCVFASRANFDLLESLLEKVVRRIIGNKTMCYLNQLRDPNILQLLRCLQLTHILLLSKITYKEMEPASTYPRDPKPEEEKMKTSIFRKHEQRKLEASSSSKTSDSWIDLTSISNLWTRKDWETDSSKLYLRNIRSSLRVSAICFFNPMKNFWFAKDFYKKCGLL